MGPSEDRFEIAFFDVETLVPTRSGQRYAILEFGSILVCPRKLVELDFYSTLVRPSDLSLTSSLSERWNGITRDVVVSAPSFLEIADWVYDILHGRIWAGHNILRFDCPRIREAFADIGRPVPEPKGTIDSLALLTQKFGRRAGNMRMATLATYFGLGQQTHRSLDDVRMNLEVLKCNSFVLGLGFLIDKDDHPGFEQGLCAEESSLPDILTERSRVSMDEKTISESSDLASSTALYEGCSSTTVFLEPDEISIPSIRASFVPFYRGSQKMKILHKDIDLQLCCNNLNVRLGIRQKYVDNAGQPRLSFVVNAPAGLSKVLESCDGIAQRLSLDSGSSSEWRPVVTRNIDFLNYPTVRLHIPTVKYGGFAMYATNIYKKESSGSVQKVVFSKCDASEVQNLFPQGTIVDAFFSLDPYDFHEGAGIRLVAKKLIIHS